MGVTQTMISDKERTKNWHEHARESQQRLEEIADAFEKEFIRLPDGQVKSRDWIMWVMVHIVGLKSDIHELKLLIEEHLLNGD